MSRNTIVLSVSFLLPFAFVAAGQPRIYWTENQPGKIKRADLDGANLDLLYEKSDMAGGPVGIALDLVHGKMYWIDDPDGKIRCANLDGSGITDKAVTGLNGPDFIELDLGAGMMFYTNDGQDRVQRANFDGSGVANVVTGTELPIGIALNPLARKVYWTDLDDGTVKRADMDGLNSNVEPIITGLTRPFDIVIDLVAGKIYWTDAGVPSTPDGLILCAGLDGQNQAVVSTGWQDPYGITLDHSTNKLCWADFTAGTITCSDLDGTNPQTVASGLSNPYGVALEVVSICGNGVVEGLEACDDGFADACGTCNTNCTGLGTGASCGDGIICPELEACDDEATDTPTCDSDCTSIECGDEHINRAAGESCDPPGGFCLEDCSLDPTIPAVSEWGVLAMLICLLIAGTIISSRSFRSYSRR